VERAHAGQGQGQAVTGVFHVLAVTPGVFTGLAEVSVPAASITGDEPPRIIDWSSMEVDGGHYAGGEWELREEVQAREILQRAYALQTGDWSTGSGSQPGDVAIACEIPTRHESLRITGMIRYGIYVGHAHRARLYLQSKAGLVTADRLIDLGMSPESIIERQAVQHAVTFLRYLRGNKGNVKPDVTAVQFREGK
jgi:hypothetical protein